MARKGAGIRFLVDVVGFEEQLVVVGADGTTVEHSEIRWPEGGIVQADTYVPDNPFMLEPGTQSLHIVTRDPQGRVGAALEYRSSPIVWPAST